MKVKLLKKLRKKGRNQIEILSYTTENGIMSGMSIAYSDKAYSDIFNFGMSREDVLKEAERIYIQKYLLAIDQPVK